MLKRTRLAAAIVVLLAGAGAWWMFRLPPGPASMRSFQPARLADLELRMWQAYYAKERVTLFRLLVVMLREQYHYSWATAATEAFHLARAAATFGDARSDYEVVLPDLETAYDTARRHLNAAFDPSAVARAELAWWVARRVPGHDSPEEVGDLMAREYALLYEVPQAKVARAAYLRAKAGRLRDETASQPDWDLVRSLLEEAYRDLQKALN